MKSIRTFERIALSLALFLVISPVAFAQDAEITDEDLKDYAVIQMAVDMITSSISPTVNEMIKAQEGMTGNRFNEIRTKSGEPAKEWETQFLQKVSELMDKRKDAAKDVVNLLINNSQMTGAKYSAIKKGLSDDADLKARYDAVVLNIE